MPMIFMGAIGNSSVASITLRVWRSDVAFFKTFCGRLWNPGASCWKRAQLMESSTAVAMASAAVWTRISPMFPKFE